MVFSWQQSRQVDVQTPDASDTRCIRYHKPHVQSDSVADSHWVLHESHNACKVSIPCRQYLGMEDHGIFVINEVYSLRLGICIPWERLQAAPTGSRRRIIPAFRLPCSCVGAPPLRRSCAIGRTPERRGHAFPRGSVGTRIRRGNEDRGRKTAGNTRRVATGQSPGAPVQEALFHWIACRAASARKASGRNRFSLCICPRASRAAR